MEPEQATPGRLAAPGKAMPLEPIRPANDECCNSGCSRCIFDVYEEALERYRAELAAWNKEHATGHAGRSA